MEPISAEYQATVDWPGMCFWRELGAAYPEATVILTVRDPERWYDSAAETILRVNGPEAEVPADRLLVCDVAQGWAPLSDFLGVPVSAGEPFPPRQRCRRLPRPHRPLHDCPRRGRRRPIAGPVDHHPSPGRLPDGLAAPPS